MIDPSLAMLPSCFCGEGWGIGIVEICVELRTSGMRGIFPTKRALAGMNAEKMELRGRGVAIASPMHGVNIAVGLYDDR